MIITESKKAKKNYGEKRQEIFSVFGDICPVNFYGSTEVRLQLCSPSHYIKISDNIDSHLTKLPEWL